MKPNWPLLSLLRFALAAVVFATHPPIVFAGAPDAGRFLGPVSAVAGFFVLSGYSIGYSLKRGVTGFYGRRIRRIYPEVVVAFLIIAVAFAVAGTSIINAPGEIEITTAEGWAGAWVFLRNLVPLWGVFYEAPTWNPPFWSLGIEVVFYALAPLLLRIKTRQIWWIVGASLVAHAAIGLGVLDLQCWHLFAAVWYAWLWLAGYLHAVKPSPGTFALIGLSPMAWQLFSPSCHGGNAAALSVAALCLLGQHEIKLPSSWHGAATRAGDFSYSLYALHVPTWLLLLVCGVADWRVALPVSLVVVYAVHRAIEAVKVSRPSECKSPGKALLCIPR